ncbi:amidohydrolase family protein [Bacillus benzoevorans]|uniref:Putative TIM-barrel fold metal-dependent hydrolase n=1 Tax=Bacillus benzoevorans TaxID=1456 RepID=A0A7X0LWN4_9BACI|nr:amidohydrolase family protein [Bacillus benzoevorans]MBB6445559.1 putative TIM-barrel fold metal-dependent hydrolase [Bacillus benzoevorans]
MSSIILPKTKSRSALLREKLGYPIVDTDFHTEEFGPAFIDVLKKVGGAEIAAKYVAAISGTGRAQWLNISDEEKKEFRISRTPWWTRPAHNTLDLATISIPSLTYKRLDEFGIDFAIVYPNLTLFAPSIPDDELRRAVVRAANIYSAEVYREYSDRLSPVAVIPMHTPEEAIEELEYAVNVLGLKAAMIAGHVKRPIPGIVKKYPELEKEAFYIDTYGIDSPYDYDPFWAKAVELKVSLSTHVSGQGLDTRRSISNYMYNHIGHFAAASEALAKSLFFGGVTSRFPSLKFAFLEGGVSWGASLYPDLIWHWQRRNKAAVEQYNPENIDKELLYALYEEYGGDHVKGRLDQLHLGANYLINNTVVPLELRDEFADIGIEKAEDIRDLFVPNFYFGIEADDPTIHTAFDRKGLPFETPLRAFLSSDAGHWDVRNIADALADSYELVEKGVISASDYKDFVFTNPVSLYAGSNPDFFKGTVVEKQVDALLKEKGGQ